jgi:hypothetical protein
VKGPIINPDAMPIRDAASVLKASRLSSFRTLTVQQDD